MTGKRNNQTDKGRTSHTHCLRSQEEKHFMREGVINCSKGNCSVSSDVRTEAGLGLRRIDCIY